MRDIKFRAWNSNKKIMVYKNEDESSGYWDGVKCSDIEIVNDRFNILVNSYIWQQYTGLKDKNGVEIYEGDIIRAKDYLTKDNKTYFDDIGVVEFRDGMFTICDDYPNSFKGQIIEIIGNIYENPELLS